MFFVALAVALLVGAGVVLQAGVARRSRPAQAVACLLAAAGLVFAGAWMFGVV